MRRFVAIIAVVLLAACSQNDRELMNGTWTVKELRKGNQLLFSSDKAIAAGIIDEQEKYAQYATREDLEREMGMRGKMQLEFGSDRTYTLTAYSLGGMEIVTTGKTITDETKKQLILESKNHTEHYTYSLSENELRLEGKLGTYSEGMLIFERK